MNDILAYYQGIKDGSIVVGKWIRLMYERIVTGLENKEFYFDARKARQTIRFVESFTHHAKGKLAPGLVKLELWQKAMLSCIFGIVDENGRRVAQEVFAVTGRKCGKSLIASGIMEKMAYADGEFGADCYVIAPKLEQADIVFSDFWSSVQHEPELMGMTKKRKTDVYIPSTNSSISKLAFSEKRADGYNPHLTVCDEIAAWPAASGLKQYEVMASALAAREQPLIFSITTAGYINDGPYDELFKRSTAVLTGNSKEKRLFPFIYQVDDPEKWNDIDELQKSLPNLGVSVSVDYILEEIAKAEGSLSKRAEFKIKYCNLKQSSAQAFLPMSVVQECIGPELKLEDFRQCYCVGGVDLSRTTDLSSACIVIERGRTLYVFSHFWMPANRLETATAEDDAPYELFRQQGFLSLSGENVIEYEDVFNWFRTLVDEYEIYPLQIGYDRYSAIYFVSQMSGYGFHMDDVTQGFNQTPVIREFEGTIKDGRIRIGNNNLLAAHFLNTAIKLDNDSQRMRIVKMGTRTRIDGCAAVLDAFCVRQKWWAEIGGQLQNDS